MTTKSATAKLSWEEIGLLCEGLSFASRPVASATKHISEKFSLGPRGAWILALISVGIVYPLDVTNVFGIGRSLMSAELARLTEANLITMNQNAKDRRRLELKLTSLGEAVCRDVKAELSSLILERFADYSREEILLCARMLKDFRKGFASLSDDIAKINA